MRLLDEPPLKLEPSGETAITTSVKQEERLTSEKYPTHTEKQRKTQNN